MSTTRFLSLLQPVHHRLYRYALSLTQSVPEAEDLTSDTILVALEGFHKLRDQERFLPYVMRIASRLYRRRKWKLRHIVAWNNVDRSAHVSSPEDIERQTDVAFLLDALTTLPEKMRETVILFAIADLTLEEVRTIQGGTVSGVKSRLRRGRQKLATALGVEEVAIAVVKKPAREEFDPVPQRNLIQQLA